MSNRRRLSVLTLSCTAVLAACGGGGAEDTLAGRESLLAVKKAAGCRGPGDRPETGLQGQVPAALRQSGFEGFNCNLELVGQFEGEGGNWSAATYTDRAGRTCAYHATAVPNAQRAHPGVPVIDITDPKAMVRTTSLTTPGMLDPWESLRVHPHRQILIAANGANGGGGPEVDVYDLSADCRAPQLLASMALGTGEDGGVVVPGSFKGHEGNIAPDGLTYYVGDNGTRYFAVDITNTSKPKLLASFDLRSVIPDARRIHGLSVSADGNRVYGVVNGRPTAQEVLDPNAPLRNGFIVLDTSEVQARLPNAQIKVVSTTLYKDGAVAQHTIPIKVGGKPYLVQVDEAGSGSLADPQNNYIKVACQAGLAPFPMARIFDISDETRPKEVVKLALETHDCANQAQVEADVVGLSVFTYGSHYCSVDNRENATALACSYFNSGIRVFDIRKLDKVREIAYYNPPSASAKAGSSHAVFGQWREGGPDWCAARLDFDFAKKQLVTMCQDNGVLAMKFAPGTWPFPQSTPSRVQN
jgi:hypothetical protein